MKKTLLPIYSKSPIENTKGHAPPYESGQFVGTNRKIGKRGSKVLRKIGYETMRV